MKRLFPHIRGWYAILLAIWLVPTVFVGLMIWTFSSVHGGLGPIPDPRPARPFTDYLLPLGWLAIPLALAPFGFFKNTDPE